jgi:hypothetical protein
MPLRLAPVRLAPVLHGDQDRLNAIQVSMWGLAAQIVIRTQCQRVGQPGGGARLVTGLFTRFRRPSAL